MSKYIKLNSAIRILWELCMPQCDYEEGAKQLESLPTIEVSEEQLSKLQASENSVENTTASEDFTSISRANSKLEVSEDAISREYVKGICEDMLDEEMLGHMLGYIEDAPSVIPKPKEGEWIYCEDYVGHDGYKCSNCGFFVPWCYDVYADSNFIRHYHTCPQCSAKMKGAEEEYEEPPMDEYYHDHDEFYGKGEE